MPDAVQRRAEQLLSMLNDDWCRSSVTVRDVLTDLLALVQATEQEVVRLNECCATLEILVSGQNEREDQLREELAALRHAISRTGLTGAALVALAEAHRSDSEDVDAALGNAEHAAATLRACASAAEQNVLAATQQFASAQERAFRAGWTTGYQDRDAGVPCTYGPGATDRPVEETEAYRRWRSAASPGESQ